MMRRVPSFGSTWSGSLFAAILMIGHLVGIGFAEAAEGPLGTCPQPRKTQQAPPEFLSKKNPLPATPAHAQDGQKLYMETAKPLACATVPVAAPPAAPELPAPTPRPPVPPVDCARA